MNSIDHDTPAQNGRPTLSRRELLNTSARFAGALAIGGVLLDATQSRAQEAAVPAEAAPNAAAPAEAAPNAAAPAAAAPAEAAPNAAMPNAESNAAMANADENKSAMSLSAGDMTILNFALGLELFEREFYSRVVQANEARKYLNGRLSEIAPVLRDNEAAHVQALTDAITKAGGTPATLPNLSFPANVFISPVSFARFAYTLEEIGAGAYLGAVGKIQSRDIRRAAASIYGVETRHAALLRHLGGFQFSPRYYEGALSVEQVTQLLAPFMTA